MERGEAEKNPLVSVCVLSYQAEAYIEDCIKSILNQTYPNIEFVLLDDASTDATVQIVERYMPELSCKCTRVEVIRHNENTGRIPQNTNELLKKGKGDYILGMAGDDALSADYLTVMVRYLEENKDCAVAYCNGWRVPDEWHVGKRPPNKYIYQNLKFLKAKNMFEELLYDNFIAAPTALVRKSVYETYGYYDEEMIYEDWDMWLRIVRKERFGFVNQKLVYYRQSVTGASARNTRKKVINSYNFDIQVLNKYLPYIDREKRNRIREHHIQKSIAAAKAQRYYDLAFRLWIKKQRLRNKGSSKPG